MGEGLLGAHGVQAGQKTPQPAQHLGVFQLWGASATAWGHGHAVTPEGAQGRGHTQQMCARRCRVDQGERWHSGHFGIGQCLGEGVLFQDLRIAPATGPVELGHHKTAIFQTDLEDAVFVGVQLQQAPVDLLPEGLQGVEDEVGREVGVRGVSGVHAAS